METSQHQLCWASSTQDNPKKPPSGSSAVPTIHRSAKVLRIMVPLPALYLLGALPRAGRHFGPPRARLLPSCERSNLGGNTWVTNNLFNPGFPLLTLFVNLSGSFNFHWPMVDNIFQFGCFLVKTAIHCPSETYQYTVYRLMHAEIIFIP